MKQTKQINPILAANNTALKKEDLEFPFKRALSFEVLYDFMDKCPKELENFEKQMTETLKDEIKKVPELAGPIEDMSILQKHNALIRGLMSMVFPVAFYEKQAFAASIPFSDDIFFSSPEFDRLLKFKDDLLIKKLNIDLKTYKLGKIISAYVAILQKFYDIHISLEFPMIVNFLDPDSGLERYYKLNHAAEFVELRKSGKLKKLSKEENNLVQANILNVKLLKELIPPENFEFRGFLVINAINVTDQEVVSSIKNDLLDKDTLLTEKGIEKLQHKLRSLLKCPELIFGSTEVPGHANLLLRYGKKIGNSFILSDDCRTHCNSIKGSIYERAFETRNLVIIDDLEAYPNRTIIEDEILKQGIRNIVLAPLIAGDEIMGILEIGSPTPGKITAISTLKLREVLPLFTIAVSRGMEELNNKIQAIIKEECTAIHPSVEWRFRNAALNCIQKEKEGSIAEMEEIVFKDVYPLYGLSDIRNSSIQRNEAIKEDLIENLNIANEIIHVAKSYKKLHALDELSYRIGKQIESIYFGLGSGDELAILNFLKYQIEPLFKHIKDYHPDVENSIKKYQKAISDELGFIYKRRKQFDDSVTMLSDHISDYIDHKQMEAQEIFPHYFEKYKTDGVDYMMYIGASLVENQNYDKLYFRNLRLWQFIIMCGIVRKAKMMKSELSLPLEIASLILVQNTPMAIRFRFDEKKFDVDGSYNVRYDIMKKRIDKAEIKGGEERLTQPGKIAIVYSSVDEEKEYIEYIDYLQAHKYLTKEIEKVELEELQGVQGLRALRVTVDMDEKHLRDSMNSNEIEKAIKELTN